MPLAQVQGEDPAVLDLDVLEDVRHQLELFIVRDQPGIAVDHHEAGVLGPADQHVQLAAGLADGLVAVELGHARLGGWPGAGRRAREQAEAEGQNEGGEEGAKRH